MLFIEVQKKCQNFFKNYKRKILNERGFHPAGVLVPFQNIHDEAYLLLTLRTDKVAQHKNQIAFPGGAFESNDKNILETALRETEEEIGIKSNEVEVWGLFDDYLTISFFKITPVVASVPYPYEFQLQENEIAEIFSVPFSIFLESKFFEEKVWEKNGHQYPVYYYYYKDYMIWGITAFIINSLVDKIFNFNPATRKIESDQRWKEMIINSKLDSNTFQP